MEYVDLFLLHYPACWPELCGADVAPAGRWQDSWKALETLVDKGLIRAIGRVPGLPLQLTSLSCTHHLLYHSSSFQQGFVSWCHLRQLHLSLDPFYIGGLTSILLHIGKPLFASGHWHLLPHCTWEGL